MPCSSLGGASRIGPPASTSTSGSLTRSASPSSRDVMSRSRSSSNIIFIRIRLRTRANSARSLNGFDRKSSAPASSPRIRSSGVSSAVTMITGMCAVSGFDFSAGADLEAVHVRHHHVEHHHVRLLGARQLQRLGAVLGDDHVVVGRGQLRAEEEPVGRDVVHNQHPTRHPQSPFLGCFWPANLGRTLGRIVLTNGLTGRSAPLGGRRCGTNARSRSGRTRSAGCSSGPSGWWSSLTASGLSLDALPGLVDDPEFLGFVLDFVLGSDATVLDFAAPRRAQARGTGAGPGGARRPRRGGLGVSARRRAPARARRARRRPRPRRDRAAAVADPAQPRPPDRAADRGGRRGDPRRGDARARGGRHRLPERRGARLPRRRRLRRDARLADRAARPRLRDGAGGEGAGAASTSPRATRSGG